jgi:hypothetical protein
LLLREAEDADAVFEIQRNTQSAEPVEEVRRRVSMKLSQIELSEVEELPGEIQASLPNNSRPAQAPIFSPTPVIDAPPNASGDVSKSIK